MKRELLLLILFFFAANIKAQDDYEAWLKKEKEKLKIFIEEEDKNFVEFLKKDWKQINLKDGETPFLKPKPKTPPVFQ